MAEKPTAETEGWVCIGQFGAPVGVRGHLRLNAFTEKPDGVFRFKQWRAGPALDPVVIRKADARGKTLVAAVEGISTPEGARALQGKMVYANRAEFPPLGAKGNFYQADLIGLEVADETGKRVGEIAAFHNFGAGQLVEVRLGDGGATVMLPFRDDVVRNLDLKNRRVEIELGPWL